MTAPTVSLSPAPAGERAGVRGCAVLLLAVLLAACGVKANPKPPEPRPTVPSQPAAPERRP